MTSQTFEEKQLGIYLTMQSLMHQIEDISREKKYKFKFKQETEMYYKHLEKVCEYFTKHFENEEAFKDSFVDCVTNIDRIAKEVKLIKI